MTHIDKSAARPTSVTIRTISKTAVTAAQALLAARNIHFSEQRLMRECLRLALRLWRGRRQIATRNKRYNNRKGPYEIVPFCSTEALRGVAWARCHHAGISLSRLMDFAIANYLPRVVEYWLRFDYHWRDKVDAQDWQKKYALRRKPDGFVISYKANTERNDGTCLFFSECTEILPWPPPLTATT